MPLSPESAVKKLSRLPANCVCANCGTVSKYGFSTVCIKYLTFVCNACKSSHQAVSHRCKSLTMSSWDHGEVLQLKTHGNDFARRVWLANAPPVGTGGRPKEGDDINVFKRFVVEAYENRRYYQEPSADGSGGKGGAAEAGDAPVPVPARRAAHPPRDEAAAKARRKPAPPQQPRRTPAPAPAPPPAVDLLDFGAFDSAPAPPQRPPQRPAPATHASRPPTNGAAAPASDPFFDPFDGRPPTTDAAVASGAADPIDESGDGRAVGAPPGAPDGGAPSAAAPSFDPFGGAIPRASVGAYDRNDGGKPPREPKRVVMNPPATAMNPPMNDSGGIVNGGMGSNNQSNTMMMNGGMMHPPMDNSGGIVNGVMGSNNQSNPMMMNGGMMLNGGRNSMAMNGGMAANGGNHFMMMNGGTMANNAKNSMMMRGGMMSSGNAMAMGGGMMAQNSSISTGNNGMMMNGGMGGMMNGNGMMMANGGMMNNIGMMHNMNGSMNPNNFMSAGGNQQQRQPPPAMNMNIMKSMNKSISNNFGAMPAAASKPKSKPDPFADLGF